MIFTKCFYWIKQTIEAHNIQFLLIHKKNFIYMPWLKKNLPFDMPHNLTITYILRLFSLKQTQLNKFVDPAGPGSVFG